MMDLAAQIEAERAHLADVEAQLAAARQDPPTDAPSSPSEPAGEPEPDPEALARVEAKEAELSALETEAAAVAPVREQLHATLGAELAGVREQRVTAELSRLLLDVPVLEGRHEQLVAILREHVGVDGGGRPVWMAPIVTRRPMRYADGRPYVRDDRLRYETVTEDGPHEIARGVAHWLASDPEAGHYLRPRGVQGSGGRVSEPISLLGLARLRAAAAKRDDARDELRAHIVNLINVGATG